MDWEGKNTVVTGGGTGIGKAAALLLAEAGASVILADVNENEGKTTEKLIAEGGGQAYFFRTDITKEQDVTTLAEEVRMEFGSAYALINCAGIYFRGSVEQTSLQAWNNMIAVNLTGIFLSCKAFLPQLRQTRGAIVNVSSSVGWSYAAPGIAAYAASKFGVTGLTKAMACDHIAEGVRINCVCPGPTDTPLLRSSRPKDVFEKFVSKQPMKRLASPEEIARIIVFLAGDDASYITGATIPVDGGQSAHS